MRKIINKSLFLLVFCFCFFITIETTQAATCTWRESVFTTPTESGSDQMGTLERTPGGLTEGCKENEEVKNDSYCSSETKPEKTGQLNLIGCCCEIETEETATTAEGFIPQVTIPGSNFIKGTPVQLSPSTQTLAEYLRAIYNYMLAVVGLLAAVVIMIGGVVWLTAAGNTERISQAKSWIGGSLIGLVLALTSFLLLKIINPNLVEFKITEIETIRPIESGCCSSEKSQDKAFLTTSLSCYETLAVNGEVSPISEKTLKEKYNGNYSEYLNGKFINGGVIRDSKCIKQTEEDIANNKKYCSGKDWGDYCKEGEWTSEYYSCVCFNEQAYYYTDNDKIEIKPLIFTLYWTLVGKLGEPCGNDINSRCVASGRCKNGDQGGAVSCYSGQTCCLNSAIVTGDSSECIGVEDGKKCLYRDDCYCFDGEPKIGKGGAGEYCGKDMESKCMPGKLICPDGYSHDGTSDTRSCIYGWKCCFPE